MIKLLPEETLVHHPSNDSVYIGSNPSTFTNVMTFLNAAKGGWYALRHQHISLLLSAPGFPLRFGRVRRHQSTISHLSRKALPRIFSPELWETIIPHSIRQRAKDVVKEARSSSKATNPATYFIWIYVLIGSQAIRIVSIKNEAMTYSRRADQQIAKLREVVEKLHRGEPVDVEKVLGTGVPEEEEAWEEAMRQIEDEEKMWAESAKKKEETRIAAKARREERKALRKQEESARIEASPISKDVHEVDDVATKAKTSAVSVSERSRAPGFY